MTSDDFWNDPVANELAIKMAEMISGKKAVPCGNCGKKIIPRGLTKEEQIKESKEEGTWMPEYPNSPMVEICHECFVKLKREHNEAAH